jgi:hypothetical protein
MLIPGFFSSTKVKRSLVFLAPVALVGVWACFVSPVEKPQTKITQETDVRVEQNIKNKVDILFMIDNSPSMSPKQAELKARFPELIKVLDNFGKSNPAWYHIGVVTSDLGAGQFNLGGGQCHPGGDGGKLQALGAAHDMTCAPPTNGLNFIDYNQLNGMNNLPAGQDLATTFGCMASVGDKGCGFEQQLESVYKAIHDMPAENHDFIRADALLVVVWVTDEDDDCSSPPNSDLFDPAQTATFGALLSYRGTQYGIECNQGGMEQLMPYASSGGGLMGCQPAPNPMNGNTSGAPPAGQGKCYDVSRYINFLSKPAGEGGAKVDPNDVILVAIAGPTNDVESILANPNPQPPGPYVACPGPVDGKTCAVVLQHSCIAAQNTQFFGDPAVRISAVVNSVKNNQFTSICDTSYQAALQSLGQLIVSNIGAGCITSPFGDPSNPDCVVEDITTNSDGSTTTNEIPACSKNGGAAPCWQLQSKPVCDPNNTVAGCCPTICAAAGDPGQHFGMTICRGPNCMGGQPPANTTARVACSTIAVPKDANGNLPMCGAPL